MKHIVACLILLTAGLLQVAAQKPFKNAKEAEAEFNKMYGADSGEVAEDWRSEYTSIAKFMETLEKHPREKVFILYSSDDQREAVAILRTWLGRKRGFSVEKAETYQTGVYPVRDTGVDFSTLATYKAIILANPSNNAFVKRLSDRGKLKVTSNRAQFKLASKPNVLVLACEKATMYTELMRVFLRSYRDFDDECYSYFYVN